MYLKTVDLGWLGWLEMVPRSRLETVQVDLAGAVWRWSI
jgi:hypothetical protein